MKESISRLEIELRGIRESVEQRFDSMDRKFELFHQELRGMMRFLIVVVISFFTTSTGFGAAILDVMAKGFHWLG